MCVKDRETNDEKCKHQHVKHLNTPEQHIQKKIYTIEIGRDECPLHNSEVDKHVLFDKQAQTVTLTSKRNPGF